MKLIRFGNPGEEKPGVIYNDQKLDVSGFVADYNEAFFAGNSLSELSNWLVNNADSCPQISDNERLGPPVARPSKIVCVGLNYATHAIESGMDIPTSPIIFFKASSSICGPFDSIIIPKNSEKTDWEVELVIVIGKKASYVEEADAPNHIAGFMIHNDVSERAFQLEHGGQWVKGKSADTFAPIGPFMVTADEVPDPGNLNLWLKVNGEKLQDGNTSDLVFGVNYLVSYLSQYMTLLPGDIISTGTPSGVGLGFKPPRYLKAGDVVELGIDGLGSARQEVVAYTE